MLKKDMWDRFGEYYFFVQYILCEKKKKPEERKFREFLDSLPKNTDRFPTLFNDDELSYLEGSGFSG